MGDPLHKNLCRVLSLDGGGAKGSYTLGALKEIEGLTGGKLCERFDLVFGTSTGAIIAALVGLGYSVDDMVTLYREHVVKIMGRLLPFRKSAALEELSAEVFGDRKFDAFKTNMGIVVHALGLRKAHDLQDEARPSICWEGYVRRRLRLHHRRGRYRFMLGLSIL